VKLTLAQQRVYDAIARFMADRGYSPSVREIVDCVGRTSATVHHHIGALARRGYIAYEPRTARTIRIVHRQRDGAA